MGRLNRLVSRIKPVAVQVRSDSTDLVEMRASAAAAEVNVYTRVSGVFIPAGRSPFIHRRLFLHKHRNPAVHSATPINDMIIPKDMTNRRRPFAPHFSSLSLLSVRACLQCFTSERSGF